MVTGAAGSIGRATVSSLLRHGWEVVAADVSARVLDLTEVPGVTAVEADACSPDQVGALVGHADGRLRGWVNLVGWVGPLGAPVHELELPTWSRVLDVTLTSCLLGCRVALTELVGLGVTGSIVNLSSVHAGRAFPGTVAYDVAKAGVEALTRSVAVEYGPAGIRCNAVAPALVAVERWYEQQRGAPDPEARHERAVARTPLPGLVSPHQVAEAVAFLLGPGSEGVTGTVLAVDGGEAAVGPPQLRG